MYKGVVLMVFDFIEIVVMRLSFVNLEILEILHLMIHDDLIRLA